MKPSELVEGFYDLDADREPGISYEELKNALRGRMEHNYPDIVAKTDPRLLDDALGDTASFNAGVEEIGSSDMNIMLRQVIRYIEQETAAKSTIGEARQKETPSFVAYVYNALPREFSDMSEVEDLFDYAYLEDVQIWELAESLSKTKINQKNAAAAVAGPLKWLLDNINDRSMLPKIKPLAVKWAKLVIPEVMRTAQDYVDESVTEDRYTDAWAKKLAATNKARKDQSRADHRAHMASLKQQEADQKAAEKARLERVLQNMAMDITSFAGEVFPDADPYEMLAQKYRAYDRGGNLIKMLDKAARKHLGAKSYNDALADLYDQQASDSPEQWGHLGGKGNPFRECVATEATAPWDEPNSYEPPAEIVSKIKELGFVPDADNQDMNSKAEMAWKARDFDKLKYKELYKFLKSIGFSNTESRAYRTRGGQHVNLDDGKSNWIQLGYDRGMSYVSAQFTKAFTEEIVESKGARILAIQKRADALWRKYSSPRNTGRMNAEDMIGLIDLISGGRTYMFTNEIERVPGAKTMMAAVNDMATPSHERFLKGLAIMTKALDKGRGPGLRESPEWKPYKQPSWEETRAEAIVKLEKYIRKLQDEGGWSGLGTGFGGGTYNRDWKKTISAEKRRLAKMKRGEGERADGSDLYESKSAILAGLKPLISE